MPTPASASKPMDFKGASLATIFLGIAVGGGLYLVASLLLGWLSWPIMALALVVTVYALYATLFRKRDMWPIVCAAAAVWGAMVIYRALEDSLRAVAFIALIGGGIMFFVALAVGDRKK